MPSIKIRVEYSEVEGDKTTYLCGNEIVTGDFPLEDYLERMRSISKICNNPQWFLETIKPFLGYKPREGKVHICQKTTSNRYFAGTDENGREG